MHRIITPVALAPAILVVLYFGALGCLSEDESIVQATFEDGSGEHGAGKAGANVNMIVHDEAGDELTALDIARRYAGSGSDRHTAIAALLTGAGGMERDKLPGGKKAEL